MSVKVRSLVRYTRRNGKPIIVRRKKRNIAAMIDIAESLRKLRSTSKKNELKVKPWKRSIFIIYDYGSHGMFFYHIPESAMSQSDFDRIISVHHKMVNIDEDKNLMWLHDHLMPKEHIYKNNKQASRDGKWRKYIVPSDKPFLVRGEFYFVVTGVAD